MVFNAVALRARWAFSALASAVLFTMGEPTPPGTDYILPLADLHLPVDPWATLALSPGPRLALAKDTIVRCAIHYKDRAEKKHEKLLIVLQMPQGATTYMVTDRGPDREEVEARRGDGLPSSSSPGVGSSAKALLSSDDIWANDRIFIPGTSSRRSRSVEKYKKHMSESYDALGTVTLGDPMSLAQLTILLKAVYQHSVHYNLLTYQCYWHSYTVWEVLRREFGGAVTQNRLQDKRGKYMGVNIRREDSVEAIIDAYKRDWQAFCEEETRSRQLEADIIRQVCVCAYISIRFLQISYRLRSGEGGRDRHKSRRRMKRIAESSRRIGGWDHLNRIGPLRG